MKMPSWLAGCFISFPIWWSILYCLLLALINQITSAYGTKLYLLLPGANLTQLWLWGHLAMWLLSFAYSSRLKFFIPFIWILILIVGTFSLSLPQWALNATFEAYAGHVPGK